ncbi:MAG TPA: nucleotide exchange factor GrpE [Actinomycetota bacterium]|nr:nucleotide exchange factor GrpE [Actinomycetota bacterium]
MTDHEQRERDEQARPTVRIVDKRRFRDEGSAPGEESGADPAAGGSPAPSPVDDLERARAEAAEYRDHLQRLQAEFENYRKRMTVSQTRLVESELQRFVGRLLEVLDEFDLALIAAERAPDFEGFRKGVELVYAKLADTLRSEGLERIEAEGKSFDPNEHEALMQTGEGDGEPHVAEVFRQGYRLNGNVIRPASVRVERS